MWHKCQERISPEIHGMEQQQKSTKVWKVTAAITTWCSSRRTSNWKRSVAEQKEKELEEKKNQRKEKRRLIAAKNKELKRLKKAEKEKPNKKER